MMHNNMDGKEVMQRSHTVGRLLAVAGVLCLLTGCASFKTTPAKTSDASRAGKSVFATPQDAVDALVAASRNNKKEDLLKILGAHADKLISSGDKVADLEGRQKFLVAYDEAHEIENISDDQATLVVGEEEWPMPIPLVKTAGGWRFDSAAGEQEILNRRIGRNELNVVQVCRAYVEAQGEFASLSPSGKEYAQHFRSHKGLHDGLYWPTTEGEPESPLGSLIAEATAEGYMVKALGKHAPYHGYFYKILKSQGPHASGGAKDYVVNGHMIKGYALLAFPARYGDSGVMTFIVNHNGIVYEKNFGAQTAKIANEIKQFDPDSNWNVVP